ncbi:MAG: endonuclease/exonuclease/phosphatase family protein [Actinomycetota bacterium]
MVAQATQSNVVARGTLRIVSWNCAGALHRKWPHLLSLKPDIAIVPEACMPDRLGFHGSSIQTPVDSVWIGRLPYKGLGVFSFGDWRIQRLPSFEERLEWILPLTVTGDVNFTLVAVWAMNHRASTPVPVGLPRPQPIAAADVYGFDDEAERLMVMGDFNSAPQWDTPNKRTFANLVNRYERSGLRSAYHASSGEPFGSESQPTHWWRDRKADGPTYHIDYAFLPESWLHASTIEIGGYERWVTEAGSDHAPLIVDVDLARLHAGELAGAAARNFPVSSIHD